MVAMVIAIRLNTFYPLSLTWTHHGPQGATSTTGLVRGDQIDSLGINPM